MSNENDYIEEKDNDKKNIIFNHSSKKRLEEKADTARNSIKSNAKANDYIELKRDENLSDKKIEEIESLEREVERLKFYKNLNIDLEVQIEEKNVELKKLQSENEKINEQISKLDQNKLKEEEIVDTSKTDGIANNFIIEDLKERLNTQEKKIIQKEAKIIKLTKKKELLESESIQTEENIKELNRQIDSLKKEIDLKTLENQKQEKFLSEEVRKNREEKELLIKEQNESRRVLELELQDLKIKFKANGSHFIKGNLVVNNVIKELDAIFSTLLRRYNVMDNSKEILTANMNQIMKNLFMLRRYYIGNDKSLNTLLCLNSTSESLNCIINFETTNQKQTSGQIVIKSNKDKLKKIRNEIEELRLKGD